MLIRSAANDTLLSYDILTNPDPLQASPLQGNVSYGALTIVVSNNTSDLIYCNQIQFSFTPGDLPQNLTDVTTGILVEGSPSDKWQIAETGTCVFTATPIKPEDNEISASGLVFQIYNVAVNQAVGTFTFSIDETASLDNINFEQRDGDFKLTKFPYGFFFSNFAPDKPQVQNGQSVTLTWLGADGAIYTLFYGSTAVDVTETRTWTSPLLLTDTTFIIEASLYFQGETVTTRLSTTVVVANPSLVAQELTVQTTSNLKGAVTVGTSDIPANLTVNGGLSASNTASMRGELTVEGAAQLRGGATVNNQFTAANAATVNGLLTATSGATVNGQFTANGSATLGNSTINGTLGVSGAATFGQATVNGQFRANSSASLMRNAVALTQQGVYVGSSDGFIVGSVYYNGGAGDKCLGWIAAVCNGCTVQATGGNTVYHSGTWSNSSCNNQQSLFLPAPSGYSFRIQWWVGDGNPNISFWWVPLGSGSVQKIGDEQLEAIPTPQRIDPPDELPKLERRELRRLVERLIREEEGASGSLTWMPWFSKDDHCLGFSGRGDEQVGGWAANGKRRTRAVLHHHLETSARLERMAVAHRLRPAAFRWADGREGGCRSQ